LYSIVQGESKMYIPE